MSDEIDEVQEDPTLGDLANKILDLKEQAAELNSQVKGIKVIQKELELQMLEMMQKQGLERTGVAGANISIQRKSLPQVKDWEAFYQFILENNALYLMQRRVSGPAITEYMHTEENIPGVEFYEEDQLSLRRT